MMKYFCGVLLTLGMLGCWKSKPLADDAMLRQRCMKLDVTCDVQWNGAGSHWMASAHLYHPYPQRDDWWFAFADSRADAVNKLYGELGGLPTDPGDPIPEMIYKAGPQ